MNRSVDGAGAASVVIGGRRYGATPLPLPEGSAAAALVRLRKADGTEYDVALGLDGLYSCDCPDFTYRARSGDVRDPGGACKHVRALGEWLRGGEEPEADEPFYVEATYPDGGVRTWGFGDAAAAVEYACDCSLDGAVTAQVYDRRDGRCVESRTEEDFDLGA